MSVFETNIGNTSGDSKEKEKQEQESRESTQSMFQNEMPIESFNDAANKDSAQDSQINETNKQDTNNQRESQKSDNEEALKRDLLDEDTQNQYIAYIQKLQTNDGINYEDYIFATNSDFNNQKQAAREEQNEIEAQKEMETYAQYQEEYGPRRVRNTGVAYFDNKKDLSLLDAYLAQMMGLDIKKLDIDLNANVKKTDVNKVKSNLTQTYAGFTSIFDSIGHYEDTYKKQDKTPGANTFANLGMLINAATGQFINTSSPANEKIISDNESDIYTMADLLAGGRGKRTNQNLKDARNLISVYTKGRGQYYAGIASGLKKARDNLNEIYEEANALGIKTTQADLIKKEIINKMLEEIESAQKGKTLLTDKFKKRNEALKILNQYGEGGITQAMRILRS